MYSILKEISDLAHLELNENGRIGHIMPGGEYLLYIYVEDSNGDDDTFYMIEANKIDEDGGCVPIDCTSADYNNFEELLLGCVYCINTYFDFSSAEMINMMRNIS